MGERIDVRETEPGQLFLPLTHLVLAGELQALCSTWVSDDGPKGEYARCVVCADLGLRYLDWHSDDVRF
jgi:hypothetical protein